MLNKDFIQFKKEIVEDDVKSLEESYKIRWYEWIPVFGAIAYLCRMTIDIGGINRGKLRKYIIKYHLLTFLFTLTIFHYVIIINPYPYYLILSTAIKKLKLI